MRLIRYYQGQEPPRWGQLTADDRIQPLSAAPYLTGGVPMPEGNLISREELKLLAPCEPSKIVAVGKNYLDHIKEFNGSVPDKPILFIKPSTALLPPDAPIDLPPEEITARVDFEGELALVIGHKSSRLRAEDAMQAVFGWTIANDVTARDVQQREGQWTRAKGMDGFAPVGPVLTDEVDPSDVRLITRLNGEIRQDSRTSMQIWKVAELLEFITQTMTLLPGDVVITGTPAGVGPMRDGDIVEVEIEGIGVLRNPVRKAPQQNRY